MLFSVSRLGLPFFSVTAVAVTSEEASGMYRANSRGSFPGYCLDFSLEADADELLLDFITFRNAITILLIRRGTDRAANGDGVGCRTRHQHGRNLFLRMNVGVRTHLYFNV